MMFTGVQVIGFVNKIVRINILNDRQINELKWSSIVSYIYLIEMCKCKIDWYLRNIFKEWKGTYVWRILNSLNNWERGVDGYYNFSLTYLKLNRMNSYLKYLRWS